MTPLPKPKAKIMPTPPKSSSASLRSKATKNSANGGQVKTKRPAASSSTISKTGDKRRRQRRSFTDKDLNLPRLNTVTPVGVQKPDGKKKGKVFVDDAESLRAILALVSAEREGLIESRMQKSRQLEAIREARRNEAEKKEGAKRNRLDSVKESLRRKRKGEREVHDELHPHGSHTLGNSEKSTKFKKRVSFG